MASGTIYLDVDDEITSAAQRIRGSATPKVALVVPGGSRIATSRMNFRLLSREAVVNNRRLSIVAADPATRALAASAGLPVFANVAEYDAAIAPVSDANGGPAATGDDVARATTPVTTADDAVSQPARATKRRAKISPPPSDDTELVSLPPPTATAIPAAAAATAADPTGSRVGLGPTVSPRRPPVSRTLPRLRVTAPLALVAAIVTLAIVAAGVGAYVLLPSAEIELTPREEAIGPISLVVVADPDATAPDADVDPPVVPATRLEIPVAVSETFETAGKRVEETAAKGEVTFRNVDFTASNTIAAGSIVSTQRGVRFKTDTQVTVPRAKLVGCCTIDPSEADVGVTAAKKGKSGNVEPNTITVIPAAEDPLTLSVRNKAETAGGTHEEFPQVEQADLDKAVEALQAKLPQAFEDAIAAGEGVPEGAQVFDDTAVLGTSTPTTDPGTLLGQEIETFELELTAVGTVIAVDDSPVEDIARARLLANVGSDHRLVEGSIKFEPGDPTVENGEVSFPISASAARVPILDPAALLAQIKGQPVERAREILAPYGNVEIRTWPEWVTSIPGIDSRLSFTIAGQGEGERDGGPPSPVASPEGSGS